MWSRRRIAAELAKPGHDVSKDTVARYMPKRPRRPGRPPSTTWGTFLRTHLAGTLAVDLLTVPTVTFDALYVFFVLSLERRRILHVNVTAHPHAAWTAQQVVEAVGPEGEVVRLIRHLRRLVRQHASYCNEDRPHMGLDRDAPMTRAVQPPSGAKIVSLPRVGGLHHRYSRAA